jgi:Xaa-Pro aminopeptidase
MEQFESRRAGLRKLVKKAGADGILVTNFTNVTYLTGFTGDDSYLLLTDREAIVISDPRYTTQLEEECPGLGVHIRPTSKSIFDATGEVLKAAKTGSLAIEGEAMTVSQHQRLAGKIAGPTVVTAGLVEQLREIKDKYEIAEIREAARYAEQAFAVLRATLRPQRTEKEVADDLEHEIRLFGGKGTSFPSIIAVGARAALPHARPTDKKIGSDDFVLVDWGATARHYKSDLTRVLVTGRISPKLERIYGVVLEAQEQGIAAIRPGITGREVDAVARKVITDAGFGKQFGHGLGHGIGLDIHEAPRLNSANDKPLRPGMVVTVEPGIYFPGWGGVRIEDDILVTKTGHEVLTSVPKQLSEMVTH